MRERTKLFSFALCALLMLGFASTAQAQILWNTTHTNNEVVRYGLTELMGEVRLTAANVGPSVGSTITVTYLGAQITNTLASNTPIDTPQAGGITVVGTNAFAAGSGITYSSINTALGGQVVISIPGGIAPAIGDQITVNGVRTDVSGRSVGSTISGRISSSPSSANSFNFQEGLVATVNESLTITTTGVVNAICVTPAIPRITLTEGFAGVFYDFTPGASPRPVFGATGNTQIRLTVTGLPSGVSLSWPATVNDSGPGGVGTLVRGTVSGTGNSTVIYQFETTNQFTSDSNQEVFVIDQFTNVVIPPATTGDDDLNVTIAATASTGVSTVQAQLWPDVTQVPRFAHPPIPTGGAPFITVTKCVTNLLFPFVANVAGYDTGMAIANTSYDVQAITPTTTPQSGPVTLYLYKSFTEPGPAPAPATFTVPNVSAGNTWAGTMSTIAQFAGSTGYLIAVAQFQYAHGFGFISFAPSGGGLVLAEGYVANVIPDIALTGNVRAASPAATAGSGENLGN